ncbi:MAG TPA: nicotinate-nicotinamide nucleotide adenylyltransferase [Polyangiaceae bacterium]
MNVAVFGGSFNPPHVAHAMACRIVAARDDVDRVLVVPAFRHPFAKELAPYADRVAMCRIATNGVADVEVSTLEADLGGESRTLRTLEWLVANHPGWNLRLVIGADILAETHKWFGFDAIVRLAPPLVLARAGVDTPGAGPQVLPDVSSTLVRDAVARGDWDGLRPLLPPGVLAYIRENGLYGAKA